MKQMKKIKRKNRRIKYNEENYINKNYMVNDKAVIPVDLEKVDDLFMRHDYKKYEMSDDVCKYIEEIAYMIPLDVDIIIELHCPEVDNDKKEKMIKRLTLKIIFSFVFRIVIFNIDKCFSINCTMLIQINSKFIISFFIFWS